MRNGLFITFEGSEGCGKSTQLGFLEKKLKSEGMDYHFVREPGGTPLGESIRHLLKFAEEGRDMTPETELLLFAASRAQLVRKVIQPRLEAGVHVLADRFLDSTSVYQGVARGLDLTAVDQINQFAIGGCMPDLTLLLDMEAAPALERARKATGEQAADRMEQEALEFYEKVRQGYLNLVPESAGRIQVVDAARAPEDIAADIWNLISDRFHGISR